jgi:hypothetical protein
VVDGLRACLRGIDEDPQVLLDALLAGEFVEPARPNRRLQRELVLGDLRRRDPLDRNRDRVAAESNM